MALDPFDRADPGDDGDFYAAPRKVVHIEPGAVEVLRAAYAGLLPRGEPILDLMSSWRSHLPDGLGPVTGLGLNLEEMEENPQLDGVVLHDLNRSPLLPFPDTYFGGVVCTVSVQYLIHPAVVFGEVHRVLRPGRPAAIAFSDRCFPTKAVVAWLAGGDEAHRDLVSAYLSGAGFDDVVDEQLPSSDDPLFLVHGRRSA